MLVSNFKSATFDVVNKYTQLSCIFISKLSHCKNTLKFVCKKSEDFGIQITADITNSYVNRQLIIACKQALQGALALRQEKEEELPTTSLEFEYLHRKSQCEMLIGEDDISNAAITLGGCFHVFFNVCLHLRSFLLHADWQKSGSLVNVEPQGNWRQNSNSRDVAASSPSFYRPTATATRKACSQAKLIKTSIIKEIEV